MIKIFRKFSPQLGKTTEETESDETKIAIRLGAAPQRGMLDAPDDKCFWVQDGPMLRNIADLRAALVAMSKEQFEHHTKRNGNDFSRWLDHVLGEQELAKKIYKLKTKQSVLKAVDQFLK